MNAHKNICSTIELTSQLESINLLLSDIGISKIEFLEKVNDVLEHMRIERLNDARVVKEYLQLKNGLEKYWRWVEKETKRKWPFEKIYKLWHILQILNSCNTREPIPAADRLHMILERALNCFNCNKKFNLSELEIHHKHPVSKGGKNEISNYEWCCKKCNQKLGNKFYWRIDT